jgi:hypothetical protein
MGRCRPSRCTCPCEMAAPRIGSGGTPLLGLQAPCQAPCEQQPVQSPLVLEQHAVGRADRKADAVFVGLTGAVPSNDGEEIEFFESCSVPSGVRHGLFSMVFGAPHDNWTGHSLPMHAPLVVPPEEYPFLCHVDVGGAGVSGTFGPTSHARPTIVATRRVRQCSLDKTHRVPQQKHA